MSEFTKGPWKYNEKLFRVIGSGQGIVDMHFGSSAYVSEMSANAHLISAAPDMYEALKRARTGISIAIDWNLDEIEIDGEMMPTYDLLHELDAALAKASPK